MPSQDELLAKMDKQKLFTLLAHISEKAHAVLEDLNPVEDAETDGFTYTLYSGAYDGPAELEKALLQWSEYQAEIYKGTL